MSSAAERPATIVDGVYVLKKRLGEGGMATVYLAAVDLERFDYTTLYAYTQVRADTHAERLRLAKDLAGKLKGRSLDLATIRAVLEAQGIPLPGERVALKVGKGGGGHDRFECEWTNLLCLKHEHVVQVYGGGVHARRPYYALELLEDIVPSRRIVSEFSLLDKIQVVLQAADGLAYLHGKGIVHRDMKPDNAVTVRRPDGSYRTVVTDLGLAKNVEEDLGMTNTQAVLGTPYFMSPEQMRSSKDVDHRTDIYSLGATLYELVTRKKPYHDKTSVFQILQTAANGERPIAPERHVEGLPEPMARIIKTAMGYDLEERYRDMRELIEDLQAFCAMEGVGLSDSVHFDQFKAAGGPAGRPWRYEAYPGRRRQPRLAAKARLSGRLPAPVAPPPPPRRPGRRALVVAGGLAAAALLVAAGVMIGSAGRQPVPEAPAKPAVPTAAPAVAPQPAPERPPAVPAGKAPAVAAPGQGGVPSPERIRAAGERMRQANPGLQSFGLQVVDGALTAQMSASANLVDLSPLAGLPLSRLAFYDTRVASFAPLAGMPLTELSCLGPGAAIKDLAPLAGTRLAKLGVAIDKDAVADLSPLKGLPLAELLVRGKVASLAPLKGLPLSSLSLHGAGRLDLTPLKGLPLERLSLGGMTVDLAQLAGLRLKALGLPYSDIVGDLSPLKGMPLATLSSDAARVADLSPLAGMPLTELLLRNSAVRDLSPLRGMRLVSLSVSGTLSDLSPLRGMPLATLWVSGAFADISPLRGLPLRTLSLSGPFADLAPLAGMPLTNLWLEGRSVTDLSPLKGLPLAQFACRCPADDLSPLAGMNLVHLELDPAKVKKGLAQVRAMASLKTINIRGVQQLPAAEFWKDYDAGKYGRP